MNNKDFPAYPIDTKGQKFEGMASCDGLSKREWFAGMALQGLLASYTDGVHPTPEIVAYKAKAYADILLYELERKI